LETNLAVRNLENLELCWFWSSQSVPDRDSSLVGRDTTSVGTKLSIDMASYRGRLECCIGTILFSK